MASSFKVKWSAEFVIYPAIRRSFNFTCHNYHNIRGSSFKCSTPRWCTSFHSFKFPTTTVERLSLLWGHFHDVHLLKRGVFPLAARLAMLHKWMNPVEVVLPLITNTRMRSLRKADERNTKSRISRKFVQIWWKWNERNVDEFDTSQEREKRRN